MKKIINLAIAITLAMTSSIDAKQIQKPSSTNTAPAKTTPARKVPVSKKTKKLVVDTKELKNATTPQEKIAAAEKVAQDVKSDPYAQLVLYEKVLLREIKELEETIEQEEGYMSYFDTEEVAADKQALAEQYKTLENVRKKLNKATTVQNRTSSVFQHWAVKTLIAAVGLVIADQLVTGGKGREALLNSASTVTDKVKSAAATGWGYTPSASGTWESAKTAFGYGAAATSLGLTLLNMKEFAKRLNNELSDEENKPNPDFEKINQLQEQLREQNQRIADLEAAQQK